MPVLSRILTRILAVGAAGLALAALPAAAQTKLKWAHVYEVSEPYHTEALWAAEEIKKRTDGKYEIQVFPASQLGNEPRSTRRSASARSTSSTPARPSSAASTNRCRSPTRPTFSATSITGRPIAPRSCSAASPPATRQRTGHSIVALTYYGERHLTANKEIKGPDDLKGMKLRVPQAPLYVLFAKSYGANATPIAFAEVYLALQQGTVDGQENPLPTIMAKKFYEVQKYIHLTGHITESLVTASAGRMLGKLTDDGEEDLRRGSHPGGIQGDRCHPRVGAEAARRVREARQAWSTPRSRSLPQGCDPRAPGPRSARLLDQGTSTSSCRR